MVIPYLTYIYVNLLGVSKVKRFKSMIMIYVCWFRRVGAALGYAPCLMLVKFTVCIPRPASGWVGQDARKK